MGKVEGRHSLGDRGDGRMETLGADTVILRRFWTRASDGGW